MDPIWKEGTISVIDGPPGTGKSTWALIMAEIYLRKNSEGSVLTNIPVKGKRYHHFSTASDMIRHVVDHKSAIVILDEAGIYATSGAGEDRRTRGNLQMFLKLIRKLNLALVWIDQVFEGSVPPAVRSMASYLFHKPDRGRVQLYHITGGNLTLKDTAYINERDLPKLEWNTYGSSDFELDMEDGFRDLFLTMARDPWGDNREALKEWLASLPGTMQEENGDGKREREYQEGEPTQPPYLHDPAEPVPVKVIVWGIIQQNPKVRNARIGEILRIDPSVVSRYRSEIREITSSNS